MSMLFIVPLISFLLCAAIGVVVYYHSGKRIEHRLFLAFCLVNAWMALSDFLFAQSAAPSMAVIWARTGIAPGIAVSFALHFVLIFSGWKGARNKAFLALLYAPNALYYLYNLFSGDIVAGIASGPWGNEIVYGKNVLAASLSGAWVGMMGLCCILVPLVMFFRAGDRRRKMQSLYMAAGFFLAAVMGTASSIVKPLTGIDVPRLSSAFTLLQELLLGYAIWRYGLLDLSPARAARNILETVSDALLIVDRDWRIASLNGALAALSGYGEAELKGRDARMLFSGSALADAVVKGDRADARKGEGIGKAGARVGRVEGTLVSKAGERLNVDVSVSELREPDGERAGFVLVARDVTDKKKAEAEREKLIDELRDALDNVKTLSGLIPICARCKKVRDDQGLWNQIESYVSSHSDALFTHGLCPDCMHALYGKEEWFKRTGL